MRKYEIIMCRILMVINIPVMKRNEIMKKYWKCENSEIMK
jgi:hypothetical protein